MKRLSRSAQRALDRYLRTLRACLSGSTSIDAHEVERDVLGHIEQELTECREPVAWARLQLVLDRLGSPLMWVPEQDLPAWKRMFLRWRIGPEDWRLAYASCGSWLVAALALAAGYEPVAAVALIAAYVFGRAARSFAGPHDEGERPRRWLTDPALLTVSLVLAGALLLAVLIPIALMARELAGVETLRIQFPSLHAITVRLTEVFRQPLSLGGIRHAFLRGGPWLLAPVGLWWLALGSLVHLRPRWLSPLFAPYLPRHRRAMSRALWVAGALLIAGGLLIGLMKHVTLAM